MTPRRPWRLAWRTVWLDVAVVAAAVSAFHWLGRVNYDTQPSAEVPSQPTAAQANEADAALAQGVQWAKDHQVTRHQTCQAELGPGLRALGCHRHVTAQKIIPPLPDWRTQPTTLVCMAAVHAHYDPLFQDMAEQGDHHAVAVWYRKRLEPDLRECQNIDNQRIVRAVHEPLARLDAMLAHVMAATPLSPPEVLQLRRDVPLVQGFRAHELRTRYLARADALFALEGGRDRIFPLAPPDADRQGQCAALAQQLLGHKAAFHEALSALVQLTERSGSAVEQSALSAQQGQQLAAWDQVVNVQLQAGCLVGPAPKP